MTDSLDLLEQFVQYTQDNLYAHFHLLLICLCYTRLLLALECTRAKCNPGSNVGGFSGYLLTFLSSFVFILYFWFCSFFYFYFLVFCSDVFPICYLQPLQLPYRACSDNNQLLQIVSFKPSAYSLLSLAAFRPCKASSCQLIKLTGIASIHFQDQQISRTWQRNRP